MNPSALTLRRMEELVVHDGVIRGRVADLGRHDGDVLAGGRAWLRLESGAVLELQLAPNAVTWDILLPGEEVYAELKNGRVSQLYTTGYMGRSWTHIETV